MKRQSQTESNCAAIGILMLDTHFPRIPGDIGNPATWPFPVLYHVVEGATADRMVRRDPLVLLDAFIAAGRKLVAEGAAGIVTTCGFLSLYQEKLGDALSVPVATSSLMQVATVNALLPSDRRAGVLTISASSLTPAHLLAAGAPEDTPIGTTEEGREFTRAILNDESHFDVEAARRDNVEAALDLQRVHPQLGAIVLECTNMVPYAAEMANATGLPIFTIETLMRWFHGALRPRRFD